MALAASLSCSSGYRPLVVKLCKSVLQAYCKDPGRKGAAVLSGHSTAAGRGVEGELASATINKARQQKSSLVSIHTCLLITALWALTPRAEAVLKAVASEEPEEQGPSGLVAGSCLLASH